MQCAASHKETPESTPEIADRSAGSFVSRLSKPLRARQLRQFAPWALVSQCAVATETPDGRPLCNLSADQDCTTTPAT